MWQILNAAACAAAETFISVRRCTLLHSMAMEKSRNSIESVECVDTFLGGKITLERFDTDSTMTGGLERCS